MPPTVSLPDADLPGWMGSRGILPEGNEFERERERQSRIARQQLRESLDRRRRFDGWMLVLLGAAISAWAHAVVQLVNRTSAP